MPISIRQILCERAKNVVVALYKSTGFDGPLPDFPQAYELVIEATERVLPFCLGDADADGQSEMLAEFLSDGSTAQEFAEYFADILAGAQPQLPVHPSKMLEAIVILELLVVTDLLSDIEPSTVTNSDLKKIALALKAYRRLCTGFINAATLADAEVEPVTLFASFVKLTGIGTFGQQFLASRPQERGLIVGPPPSPLFGGGKA